MEFEWDEKKASANLDKHGVSFLTAAEIFGNETWSGSTTGKTMGKSALLLSAGLMQTYIGLCSPGAAKASSAS